MFIFASHRKPLAPDSVIRSANLSESLLETAGPGHELEKSQGNAPSVSGALSCSPPPEEYVVL